MKIKGDILTKARVWCIRNEYKVYPTTKDNHNYQVVAERGVNKAIVDKLYNKYNIHKGIDDMVLRIYKKKSNG